MSLLSRIFSAVFGRQRRPRAEDPCTVVGEGAPARELGTDVYAALVDDATRLQNSLGTCEASSLLESCLDPPFRINGDSQQLEEVAARDQLDEAIADNRWQDAQIQWERAINRSPQTDILYARGHTIHTARGDEAMASAIVYSGLARGRGIVGLCTLLGNAALCDPSKERDALSWFARACAVQLRDEQPEDYYPFLNLAYFSEALGARTAQRWYFAMADALAPFGPSRFDLEDSEQRFVVVNRLQSSGDDVALEVIGGLHEHYAALHPAKVADDYPPNWRFPPYTERRDDRYASSFDEVTEIDAAQRAGDLERASALCDAALDRFSDSFVFFARAARVRDLLGDPKSAEEILMRGVYESLSKCSICTALADRALVRDLHRQAVKWWVRSCALQLTSGLLVDSKPFLALAYVSAQVGDRPAEAWYLAMADRANPIERVRVNQVGVERYETVARALMADGADDAQQVIHDLFRTRDNRGRSDPAAT